MEWLKNTSRALKHRIITEDQISKSGRDIGLMKPRNYKSKSSHQKIKKKIAKWMEESVSRRQTTIWSI